MIKTQSTIASCTEKLLTILRLQKGLHFSVSKSKSGHADIIEIDTTPAKWQKIRTLWRASMAVKIRSNPKWKRGDAYVGVSALVEHPTLGDIIVTCPNSDGLRETVDELFYEMEFKPKLVKKTITKKNT